MKTNTTVRLAALLSLGSAALTAAALVPTAAAAAPPAPALAALVDRDETGALIKVPGKPGELVSPVLGVANLSGAPIKGAAVRIQVIDGLDLPRTFANCHYFDWNNLEGAWCQFDEELPADKSTHALDGFRIAMAKDAKQVKSIIFSWATPEEVTRGGGIEALAKKESFTQKSAPGTGGKLHLAPRKLRLPAKPDELGFAGVKLDVPPPASTPSSTAPSASATVSPPATPTVSPSPAPGEDDGGKGGGLAATGSGVATMLGAGVVLLLAGGAAYLIARRRAKFQA